MIQKSNKLKIQNVYKCSHTPQIFLIKELHPKFVNRSGAYRLGDMPNTHIKLGVH